MLGSRDQIKAVSRRVEFILQRYYCQKGWERPLPTDQAVQYLNEVVIDYYLSLFF